MNSKLQLGGLSHPSSDSEACEQRKNVRHQPNGALVLRFLVRPTFESYQAVVRDISLTGIGFVFDDPLEEGTIMALQLRGCSSRGTSQVRTACVMHSRPFSPSEVAQWEKPFLFTRFLQFLGMKRRPEPRKDYWLVGCEFRPPLTEAELEEVLRNKTGK